MTSVPDDIRRNCHEDVPLPRGWVWARLEEIAQVNPRLNENYPNDTEVTFIPMKAVEELSGRVDTSATKKLSQVRKGYTPFMNGDILFAKITPCMENGKVAIVHDLKNGIGFGSTEFHVVRLHESLARRLFFFFLTREDLRKDAQSHMTGSVGQKRVPKNYIEQIMIPLAPLSEQRRIVAKVEELLSKLDDGVKSLQTLKAQLKRYRQSVLKSASEGKLTEKWRQIHEDKLESASKLLERILREHAEKWTGRGKYREPKSPEIAGLPRLPEGWCWASVEQLNPPMRPCAYGVLQPGLDVEGGVPLVRVGDVADGRIDLENLKRISAQIAARYPRTRLEGGEVLVTLVGAIGRSAVVPPCLAGGNVARAVGVIPLTTLVDPSWIEFWFRSPSKTQEMISKAHEVARKTLNLEDVRKALVAIPPLPEQRFIVTEVERLLSIVDEQEIVVGESIKSANSLRQSVLKHAFEGKLVSQDNSDEPASLLLERVRTLKTTNLERHKMNGKDCQIQLQSEILNE